MESNESSQTSASCSKVVVPVQFETAIWKDLADDISTYNTRSISDSDLCELTKANLILYSPRKDFTNVTTAYYKRFRLQEYRYLRDKFPDLESFVVERSKTDQDRRVNKKKFLVQVGSTGYYVKQATLKSCTFFRKFFSKDSKDCTADRCHILPTDDNVVPEQVSAAIMEYLCGTTVDFTLHSWKDILLAGDYYGCHDIQKVVDHYLCDKMTDWEEAVWVQYNKFQSGWYLPKTAKVCVELVKSNLHIILNNEKSDDLIGQLTYSTMASIFADRRLTFFTVQERRGLVIKWIRRGETPEDFSERESFLHHVDIFDDSCPSVSLKLQKLNDGCHLEHHNASSPICLDHPRPTIIVAGGTGMDIKHRSDGKCSRPLVASKSLMAYRIDNNGWSYLPDLPIGMFKPMVATNDLNTIYIIDSYAFRKQDAIKEHCLFNLVYNQQGWHWKSFTFGFPVEICSFQLLNIFHVNGEIYMLGISKVHKEVIREWSMGSLHREQLHARLEEQQLSPPGVVVLMSFDSKNSTVDVVKFLFHADIDEDIKSCVMGNKICAATWSGYFLEDSPSSYTVFAVYNVKLDRVFCEKDIGSPRDSLGDDDGNASVPRNTNGTDSRYRMLSLSMDGKDTGTLHFTFYCFIDGHSNAFPHAPCLLLDDADSLRRSPMVVVYQHTLYYLGGWCTTTKQSLDTCLSIKITRDKRRMWHKLAPLPRKATNGGFAFSFFIKQPLSHHLHCPHCVHYPEDVLQADVSGVQLPANYEANLVAAYPPTEYF